MHQSTAHHCSIINYIKYEKYFIIILYVKYTKPSRMEKNPYSLLGKSHSMTIPIPAVKGRVDEHPDKTSAISRNGISPLLQGTVEVKDLFTPTQEQPRHFFILRRKTMTLFRPVAPTEERVHRQVSVKRSVWLIYLQCHGRECLLGKESFPRSRRKIFPRDKLIAPSPPEIASN